MKQRVKQMFEKERRGRVGGGGAIWAGDKEFVAWVMEGREGIVGRLKASNRVADVAGRVMKDIAKALQAVSNPNSGKKSSCMQADRGIHSSFYLIQ